MEITSRPQDRENPSPTNSPNKNNNNGGGGGGGGYYSNSQTPPLTPKSISRSDSNPYPTTFVQADTNSFKQVVQMLTGSSETAKHASKPPPSTAADQPPSSRGHIPPVKTGQQKKQSFKLYERRNSLKNGLMINPLITQLAHSNSSAGFSPRKAEILSPSILDFPSLVLSPVTPLIEDPFDKSSAGSSSEEDRVIAEKGFYLHPSPRTTPRGSEPQLLPLFPVTSPRVSGDS